MDCCGELLNYHVTAEVNIDKILISGTSRHIMRANSSPCPVS